MPAFAVIVTSAAGMALEVAFGRSAGPFLGTSTEVWAAIIAVALAALASGAWLGGHVADRVEPRRALAGAVAIAALLAGFAAVTRDAMSSLGLAVAAASGSLFLGAAVAAAIVVAPATVAIGAVSPIAARISLASLGRTGRTMGRLGAAGAGGSVLGTVATGAFALPYAGSAATFAGIAAALAVAAGLVAARASKPAAASGAAIAGLGLVLAIGATALPLPDHVLADVDTRYARLLVVRDQLGRDTIQIATDPFGTQCAAFEDEAPNASTSSLPFTYTRWLGLADETSGAATSSPVLVVGGCNLSFPRHMAARGRTVDVIEIDPGMTRVAREIFGAAEDPRLRVTHGDARVVLAGATTTYRAAALDAFGSFSTVPYHLATEEFFATLRARMEPEGAVAINVIGARAGESGAVTSAIMASARGSFARVALLYSAGSIASSPQNLLVLAFPGDGPSDVALAKAAARHGLTVASAEDLALLPETPALSDDRSPIERLTAPLRRERLRQIARGLGVGA